MQFRGLNAPLRFCCQVRLYLNVHAVRSKRAKEAQLSGLQVLTTSRRGKSLSRNALSQGGGQGAAREHKQATTACLHDPTVIAAARSATVDHGVRILFLCFIFNVLCYRYVARVLNK